MKKLFKIIFLSFTLSFILSLLLSIIHHTPLSQREENTYYFSIGENIFFSMIYLTPVLLSISILAYVFYLLIKKIKHIRSILNIIVSLFLAIVLTGTMIYFLNDRNKTDDIYLIPEEYEGEVYVFYNVKGTPKVETEGEYEVHTINEKGYFVTSTPDMDYGKITDQYYYVDSKGQRTPIDETCVSSFGTSGYSENNENETTIDLVYTGFILTKRACSKEFQVQSAGEGEKAQKILQEVIKQYY